MPQGLSVYYTSFLVSVEHPSLTNTVAGCRTQTITGAATLLEYVCGTPKKLRSPGMFLMIAAAADQQGDAPRPPYKTSFQLVFHDLLHVVLHHLSLIRP